MMKRSIIVFSILSLFLAGCKTEKNSSPIYRTAEQWQKRYSLEKFHENEKLDKIPSGRPYAKCINGTFVGNTINGIDVYKGIPYAQAPVGELRFKKAQSVLNSNDIFDASYFGKSAIQPVAGGEFASEYEQGEDCLRLNIWNNNSASKSKKKPVFVYIHGGGFVNGGTSDPLYDGWNFAYYNPDIIVVTITYRLGVMGYVDFTTYEDGAEYKTAPDNASYDQVEALRWVKNNIENFGGDKNNITVCGESAGGASVSILCVMDEAKGLFNKAIPMSGAVNLCVPTERTKILPATLKEVFKTNKVKDLQAIPADELAKWWRENSITVYNFPVMDGVALPKDLFKCYEDGVSKDLIILQGHTHDEFRYYYSVFNHCKPMYLAICDLIADHLKSDESAECAALFEEYKKAVIALGYPEKEVNMCFADDINLAISNTYQAICHANAGGKGYSYTFNIPYDEKFEDFELGAAHAIDCFYLFGNFDGQNALGTNEEVDDSIRFQKMIANFCKTGDPSIEGIKWPVYNNKTRYKMIISPNDFKVAENPEKERVDLMIEILKKKNSKYSAMLSAMISEVFTNQPDVYEAFMEASSK